MKKSIIILLTIFGLFFCISKIITRVFSKQIKVNATQTLVNEQLNNIKTIVKWYIPFNTYDSSIIKFETDSTEKATYDNNNIELIGKNGIESFFNVNVNNNNKKIKFNYEIDSLYTCNLKIQYESNLWDYIFNSNKLNNQAIQSLQNFKEYLEDSKRMYGIEITRTTVSDSTFLFITKTVLLKNKQAEFKKIFEDLINYSKALNAEYNGTRIFYLNDQTKDSVTLYCSIGIKKSINQNIVKSPYSFKKMPYGKNLLVTYYQGKFGNIESVYPIIDKYKSDNKLMSMAIPFVRILNEGYDFNDDQIVQVEVCFPIL